MDRGNKSVLRNGITSPYLVGSNQEQGEVGTGTLPKGVSEKRKMRRSATKQIKAKNHAKTSIQRESLLQKYFFFSRQ